MLNSFSFLLAPEGNKRLTLGRGESEENVSEARRVWTKKMKRMSKLSTKIA